MGMNSSKLTVWQILLVILVGIWMFISQGWRFLPFALFVLIVCQLIQVVIVKIAGVPITKITFGFPPHITSLKLGKIEYDINLIPLSFLINIDDNYLPDSKILALVITRSNLLIFFLVGILAITFGFFAGGTIPSAHLEVLEIYPNSPAYAAGLQPHDTIYKCNGEEIFSIQQLSKHIETREKNFISLTLVRNNSPVEVSLPLENGTLLQMSTVGWKLISVPEMKVMKVETNSIASASGIKVGDIIYQIDGHGFPEPANLKRYIEQEFKRGDDIILTIKRDGLILSPITLKNLNAEEKKQGIGIKTVSVTTYYQSPTIVADGLRRSVEILMTSPVGVFLPMDYTFYPLDINLWDEIPFNGFAFCQLVGFIGIFLAIFNFVFYCILVLRPKIDLTLLLLGSAIVICLRISLGMLSGIPFFSFLNYPQDLVSGNLLGIGNIISFTL